MKTAQILHNRLHRVFEAAAIPNWPPDPEGNPIVHIDVTGINCKEGDGFNPVSGAIVPYPDVSEREGYTALVEWNEDTCQWKIEYAAE